jgi:hypothetical protein
MKRSQRKEGRNHSTEGTKEKLLRELQSEFFKEFLCPLLGYGVLITQFKS